MSIINAWKPEEDVVLHQALGKLAEECSELAKIAMRCMIQGYAEEDPVTHKLNRTQLMEEVADVKATMRWLFDVLDQPFNGESSREARKFDGFKRWEAMLRAGTEDPKDWIKHEGKTMPVNGSVRVEVRLANGFKYEADFAQNWLEREGSKSNWHHDLGAPHPCDIVEYRVVRS